MVGRASGGEHRGQVLIRSAVMTIRPYRPADADALYDVCLRTGDDGEDARERFSDPRLLGAVYVGPYLALEPDLAFVLDDGGGAEGYVLGSLDTAVFERECAERWWPGLREQYPVGRFAAGSADAGLVALVHDPPVTDRTVLRAYPSHLHIDLLPRWQGAGWGRRLIETLLSALTAAGSPGVHLGVSASNERAISFYRRMGFVDLTPGGSASGRGLAMGCRLREQRSRDVGLRS